MRRLDGPTTMAGDEAITVPHATTGVAVPSNPMGVNEVSHARYSRQAAGGAVGSEYGSYI